MNVSKSKSTFILAAILTALTTQAQANVIISEVDANGSAASYAADWFELTNTGSSTVDISNWRVDDNSNLFANSVALRGVTSIAAGQSVIFLEGTASGSTDATINSSFKLAWFGSNVPTGLIVGNYGGSGVGLSASADAVNIFSGTGAVIARVDFGASTLTTGTFNNAAGLNNVTITQKSVVGTNGAFLSVTGSEIGSPASVAAVPEADTYAMLLAGLGLVGFTARRKQKSTE